MTPIPNRFIDELMPALKDTEWRLLCVIARSTLGWSAGAGRKRQDWLSHRQLKERSGRASEAVCGAIDSLVGKGLIEVCNSGGVLLQSPAERRRSDGPLYFRLSSRALGGGSRKTEKLPRKTEIRKAKTTKETDTKRIPNGITEPAGAQSGQPADTEDGASGSDMGVREFLQVYRDLFRAKTLRGEAPPVAWGKDSRLARELLSLYGFERLLELLQQFFAATDPWIRRSGYSLGAFRAAIGQLLVREQERQPLVVRSGGWSRVGYPHGLPGRTND